MTLGRGRRIGEIKQAAVVFLWNPQREKKFYVKNKDKYYFLTETFYFLFIQLEMDFSFILGPNFFVSSFDKSLLSHFKLETKYMR